MTVLISRRRITLTLVIVTLSLIAASIIGQVARYATGTSDVSGLYVFIRLFHLNLEYTISSWYASAAILLCSFLAGAIAAAGKQNGLPLHRHFAAMSMLFLLMSIDETAGLHERIMFPLWDKFQARGLLLYAWVIVGIPAVLVVGMGFIPFLLALPRRIASLFVAAGTVYVLSAIGMEMIGGPLDEIYGQKHPIYLVAMHVEETLEMTGVIMFAYALLSCIDLMEPRLLIAFSPSNGDDSNPPGGPDPPI